jgi:spore germination protein GerM
MRPLRSIRSAVVCVVLTLGLAACGVPTERSPRPIAPLETRSTGPSTPGASTSSSRFAEMLFLVKDGKLVAVSRPIDRPPTLDAELEHLLAGPTAAEHDAGLTSALTGLGITARVQLHLADAVVDLGNQPDETGRSDEVLAYGQLVCTLTARPDVDRVSFRYNGQPVGVPRADGSLAQQPLTAADYAILLAPG